MKVANDHSYNFELTYLSELTRKKIKPLSRWEKPLNNSQYQLLESMGFYIEKVPRKTLSGRKIHETVFSNSSRYVNLYSKKFSGSFINKAPKTQTIEGFLFGYPSCCCSEFIEHPYKPNSLSRYRQSLLFHWACPGCRVTPELLPYYQLCYENAVNLTKEFFPEDLTIPGTTSKQSSTKIQNVLAALLLSAGLLSAQSISDSTHYIPLPDDNNNNGLSYTEEFILGGYGYDEVNICAKHAVFFKSIIDTLPTVVQTDRTYKTEYLLRGVVECPKCGELVNMGYITITNPRRNINMDIPILGLHFMHHGFFSYGDNDNYERISVDTLKQILYPFDPDHLIHLENDTDGDGITDTQEDSIWICTSNISDYNDNGNPDGVDLAEEIIRLFPKLKTQQDGIHSQVQFYPMWGIENCKICGSTHNMGSITITNPENNRKCTIPYIALHSLAHGSFGFDGTIHENGHVNAVELLRSVKTHLTHINNDTDNDGLSDDEELFFESKPDSIDTDNNGIPDCKQLAAEMVDIIESMPTSRNSLGYYTEHLDMDGVHLCAVCGKEIPMGIINIYNPAFGSDEPFVITYYAYHFMKNGSFGCDGTNEPARCPSDRIDPVLLSQYLAYPTGVDQDETNGHPAATELEQNFPNPFNPTTKITFKIPFIENYDKHSVKLVVYNALGEYVREIFNGELLPGKYEFEFNAADLPSGVYLYSLQDGNRTIVRKMALLK